MRPTTAYRVILGSELRVMLCMSAERVGSLFLPARDVWTGQLIFFSITLREMRKHKQTLLLALKGGRSRLTEHTSNKHTA